MYLRIVVYVSENRFEQTEGQGGVEMTVRPEALEEMNFEFVRHVAIAAVTDYVNQTKEE
jgi:hypothetical protein